MGKRTETRPVEPGILWRWVPNPRVRGFGSGRSNQEGPGLRARNTRSVWGNELSRHQLSLMAVCHGTWAFWARPRICSEQIPRCFGMSNHGALVGEVPAGSSQLLPAPHSQLWFCPARTLLCSRACLFGACAKDRSLGKCIQQESKKPPCTSNLCRPWWKSWRCLTSASPWKTPTRGGVRRLSLSACGRWGDDASNDYDHHPTIPSLKWRASQ